MSFTTYLLNMFTTDDKVLISALRVDKGSGARKMMSKFPGRNWKLSYLSRLIKKIDETGSLDRKVEDVLVTSWKQISQPCIDREIREFRK